MKFITRFLIIYAIVTVIVLGIGGYISYFIIRGELNNDLKWRLVDRVHRVTDLLEKGKSFEQTLFNGLENENLTVRALPYNVESSTAIEDTLVWHDYLEQMEPNLKLTAYRTVKDTSYFISTYGTLVETDDIIEAVGQILFWILLMQVIGAIILAFIISNRLFEPFRQTIDKIKLFDIQDKKPITTENSAIKEFDDLNIFVEKMTRKAVSDYENLKEFAENASHEIKTPLAIARGKLELLSETSLNKQQLEYIDDTQRAISKLSKLGSSLSLLTKIDNQEFTEKDEVNLTALVQENINDFHELISLRNLTVKTELQSNVVLYMPAVLADILCTNLFQNAIKHNIEEGFIHISLTSDKLTIENPGPPIDEAPETYFNRFKKSDPSSSSIGLGLAIVKRIVDQNNFNINYSFNGTIHKIEIIF